MNGIDVANLYEDIGDEFAFLNMNKIMYFSARPALTKASTSAAAAKQPYGITISTTPKLVGSYNSDIIEKTSLTTGNSYRILLFLYVHCKTISN